MKQADQKRSRRGAAAVGPEPVRSDPVREPAVPAPYHHGDLRAGLLAAAERILVRDGIQGLTLRAAAREAGVSHAAPKNHFGDLTGLLSDLAAVGFERFNQAMAAAQASAASPSDHTMALGRGYVRFARENSGLFLLMFRGERLDFMRPALATASTAALNRLASAAGGPEQPQRGSSSGELALPRAAAVVASWAYVHGLAMLLIDGRLAPIIARLPDGLGEADLLAALRRDGG